MITLRSFFFRIETAEGICWIKFRIESKIAAHLSRIFLLFSTFQSTYLTAWAGAFHNHGMWINILQVCVSAVFTAANPLQKWRADPVALKQTFHFTLGLLSLIVEAFALGNKSLWPMLRRVVCSINEAAQRVLRALVSAKSPTTTRQTCLYRICWKFYPFSSDISEKKFQVLFEQKKKIFLTQSHKSKTSSSVGVCICAGFVMCVSFGNMCARIYCVYCIVYFMYVSSYLFCCTATEWQLNCS
jgi:hypothetical protein